VLHGSSGGLMMSGVYKTMRDAAQVAGDIAEVAAHFQNIPAELVHLSQDVVSAVWNHDLTKITQIKTDFANIIASSKDDLTQAQSAINAFNNDLDMLISDFSV
jgi:hypothetical protein